MTEKFDDEKSIDVSKLVAIGFIGAVSVAAAAGLAIAAKKMREGYHDDEGEDDETL